MNYLKLAFETALIEEGISKQTFAEQRDINPSRVSRFLEYQGHLSPIMKSVILIKWSNPRIPALLWAAHLKDEAESMSIKVF